jgi:MoxR-vWA-beta-propeller ternary system domain bpX4
MRPSSGPASLRTDCPRLIDTGQGSCPAGRRVPIARRMHRLLLPSSPYPGSEHSTAGRGHLIVQPSNTAFGLASSYRRNGILQIRTRQRAALWSHPLSASHFCAILVYIENETRRVNSPGRPIGRGVAIFLAWLSRVLTYGESVLAASPRLLPEERTSVVEALRSAFEQHALDVAGPPIAFDPEAAVLSAVVLARACWRFVEANEDAPVRSIWASNLPRRRPIFPSTWRFDSSRWCTAGRDCASPKLG